jgi:hypothetical protein
VSLCPVIGLGCAPGLAPAMVALPGGRENRHALHRQITSYSRTSAANM